MISHKTPLAVGSGWRAALFARFAAARSAATRTTSSMLRCEMEILVICLE